jgi:hypothetical protein
MYKRVLFLINQMMFLIIHLLFLLIFLNLSTDYRKNSISIIGFYLNSPIIILDSSNSNVLNISDILLGTSNTIQYNIIITTFFYF